MLSCLNILAPSCLEERFEEEAHDMPRRLKKRLRATGVTLEEPVVDYLDELADREERNRSYFINRIVREHAERNGTPIPSAEEEPAAVQVANG